MRQKLEGHIVTAEYVGNVRARYKGDADGELVISLDGKAVDWPYVWCLQDGFVIHWTNRYPRSTGSYTMLHIDHGDVRVEYPLWWPRRDWYIEQAEIELLAKESNQ